MYDSTSNFDQSFRSSVDLDLQIPQKYQRRALVKIETNFQKMIPTARSIVLKVSLCKGSFDMDKATTRMKGFC